jgi:hypothetical protein
MLLAVILAAMGLLFVLPLTANKTGAQMTDDAALTAAFSTARSRAQTSDVTISFSNGGSATSMTISDALDQDLPVAFPDVLTINGQTSGTITVKIDGSATLVTPAGSTSANVAVSDSGSSTTWTLKLVPLGITRN